jgi:Flp pilus assembly protein TadB
MRRIYFLVPNTNIARKIVDDLLLARIEERRIHVLAKRGTSLEDLPEATFLQKTDFMPALEQGLALGGLTGALAGLVAVAVPGGLVLAGGAVLGISLAGAGFGALVSSMVGSSVGNRRLKQFEEALERGEMLVMIDVARDRVEEIEQLVKKHHPEAESHGTEPTIPPFP